MGKMMTKMMKSMKILKKRKSWRKCWTKPKKIDEIADDQGQDHGIAIINGDDHDQDLEIVGDDLDREIAIVIGVIGGNIKTKIGIGIGIEVIVDLRIQCRLKKPTK